MKLFACVEDRGGFSFFNKRLSRDRILIENMLSYVGNKKLYIEKYSEELFKGEENIIVRDNPFEGNMDGYVFTELIQPTKYEMNIESVILYLWNRAYPYSNKLELDFFNYDLVEELDFKGNSHDKISRLIYNKRK